MVSLYSINGCVFRGRRNHWFFVACLDGAVGAFVDVHCLLGSGLINYDALMAMVMFNNPLPALLTLSPRLVSSILTWSCLIVNILLQVQDTGQIWQAAMCLMLSRAWSLYRQLRYATCSLLCPWGTVNVKAWQMNCLEAVSMSVKISAIQTFAE